MSIKSTAESISEAAAPRAGQAAGSTATAWKAYGSGDYVGAVRLLAALPEHRQAEVEVAFLLALASGRAGDKTAASAGFRTVLQGVEQLDDPTRRSMLRRLARGHLNLLDHGTWDLEPETWERA
jgi:hypothetical protein